MHQQNIPQLNIIIGLGASGLSIVRYLRHTKQQCLVLDDSAQPAGLAQLQTEFPEVAFQQGTNNFASLDTAKLIIVSPGVPPTIPFLIEAKTRNIPIIGDVELFARNCNAPVVAITGTNGKSTVTTLVGLMAKAAGKKVAVGGNLGEPVLNFLLQDNYELYVLELSSFQLDTTCSLQIQIATILNISPDHLYRYGTVQNYVNSKHQIYKTCQQAVYNRDDPFTKPQQAITASSFGLSEPKVGEWGIRIWQDEPYLAFGADNLLAISSLRIAGTHNWLNALAALAIGHNLDLELSLMLEVLKNFTGLPHRCQWVAEKDRISWYNDSKGTNVGAAISAIQGLGGAMKGKIVLIAGGQGEGADFAQMHDPVKDYVRILILIGEDANKIASALHGTVPIIQTDTLQQAVKLAQQNAKPGDAVLLSPACKSFDMFKNYAHRGEEFTRLVQLMDN